MLVIGSSTMIGIVLGIIRVKVLAVLLGPTGVGIMGIYANIHQTGVQLAGLGLGQSGVRQIAASKSNPGELGRVRKTLFAANLIQGVLGMAILWLTRERISIWMFDTPDYGFEVGLMGLGVLLSLISASQTALLQGMRQIDELAGVGIVASLLATLTGVAAVWLFGADGLVLFILSQPVFMVLIAYRHVRRLPYKFISMNFTAHWVQWKAMVGLGVTFMSAGLLSLGGLLVARSIIVHEMGLETAGYFQAAWSISMQYVGFLLTAMGADYFPRLSEIIFDRDASTALVNDQAQIGLALGGPILLVLLGLAPWIIPLLYSETFHPAVSALQWMCVGNLFKLVSWPIGFILIAHEDKTVYVAIEILWNILFLGIFWVALPIYGVTASGIAFTIAYGVFFSVHYIIVRWLHGFRWQTSSIRLFGVHIALSSGLLFLTQLDPIIGAVTGVAVGAATGVWGLRIVAVKIGPDGRLGKFASDLFEFVRWPLPNS